MARIKYYYDTETCKYERIKTSTGDIILNAFGILCLGVTIAACLLIVGSTYFESPKELLLRNEVKEMEFYYENLSAEVEKLQQQLLTSSIAMITFTG
jgi:hypothetical protein